MEERLKEVLQGREGNYIIPFFWQHGESEETLREYMEKIHMSGIRAVCVESRPHPRGFGTAAAGLSAWNPDPIPIMWDPAGGGIWM